MISVKVCKVCMIVLIHNIKSLSFRSSSILILSDMSSEWFIWISEKWQNIIIILIFESFGSGGPVEQLIDLVSPYGENIWVNKKYKFL